ncbi:MvaI/BcnI family restriction endonuclease [Pseudogemmatithrix spongiicola]|uniref:MvaI/BcnI family restriction endonuclease n=1 Tax=Pseudogemmatithrix spongiicola TaxID=3062599 RepID=A0AA49Q4S9_9BACT|nr:MvaI/BcnI family restriction endonuclease [Gemmatimonadaceae bacterium 'strain 138']WKW14445.1 MvaI/BcnI family restriction endonuclease [Gemmatimonadaceae bacterium 'strain 318']
MSALSLAAAKQMLRDHGARRIYAKALAPNDNSKNQVYLGGDFEVLQVIPGGEPVPGVSGTHGEPIFKSALTFSWLDDEGRAFPAPAAQLILYPQYPEVRMSGFLRGAQWAPNDVLTVRDKGRVLLLGVTATDQILGIAAGAATSLAHEIRALGDLPTIGVLLDLGVPGGLSAKETTHELLRRVDAISKKGWIESWRLLPDGSRAPCTGSNCGGVTLESELGILANGRAEPDFLGWEVKSATVANLSQPRIGTVTLMTPEPTGGFYRSEGVEAFVRRFGYPDKLGRPKRLNFGGIHKFGVTHASTGLRLTVNGFDVESETLVRADGALELLDPTGIVAASWSFSPLLAHWNSKHAHAAYVPSVRRNHPSRSYAYGASTLLAEGTSFLSFLLAVVRGAVYYDPGIKLETTDTGTRTKRRSQWRISGRELGTLYRSFGWYSAVNTARS